MGGRGAASATSAHAAISGAAKATTSKTAGKITGAFSVGRTVYYERDGKLYSATKSEYKQGKGVAISGMNLSTMRSMQRVAGKKIEKVL